MGALAVVELDPLADTGFRLRSGFPGVQVDAFVFQAPPEQLNKYIVKEAPFLRIPEYPGRLFRRHPAI